MRENEFRTWLEQRNKLNQRPVTDYISRCRRVERGLQIDLDEEYQKDGGYDTIKLLTNTDNAGRLNFSEAANVKKGLASLRSVVRKYFEFCQN